MNEQKPNVSITTEQRPPRRVNKSFQSNISLFGSPTTAGGAPSSSTSPSRFNTRTELMEFRRQERLSKQVSAFGYGKVCRREPVNFQHFTPSHNPPRSYSATFRAKFEFHDPDTTLYRHLSPIRSREITPGLTADPTIPVTRFKPYQAKASKFLHLKGFSETRPRSGTLSEGAPMYSSFSPDRVFRPKGNKYGPKELVK